MRGAVRMQIAILFYVSANILVFTGAVYAATLFPPLLPHAGFWIGAITAAGMFVTAPIAWFIGVSLPPVWNDRLVARQSPLAHAPSREI